MITKLQKFFLVFTMSVSTSAAAFALGPDDNAELFAAYQSRLRERRYNAMPMRQARAMAHQSRLRSSFYPPTHASLLRYAMNPSGINYNGPPVRYVARPRAGYGICVRVVVESEN